MPSHESKHHFYVIHQRPFQDKKSILTLFIRNMGKVQVVYQVYSSKKAVKIQPMREYIGVIKSSKGLMRLSQVEQINFSHAQSYLCQLGVLYLNELIYWLVPEQSEMVLYEAYVHFMRHLEPESLALQLRFFEVRLLDILGYGVVSQHDVHGKEIHCDAYYLFMPLKGFVPISPIENAYRGEWILSLCEGVEAWNGSVLKMIRTITKAQIDACLEGRELRSRELLREYLQMKHNTA